jgi:hypothetical protein
LPALCGPFLGPSHESPVLLKKFHIAPRFRPLMSLVSIKKGSQINMPEGHQGFTLMQTQGLRFPAQLRYLSKAPPKSSSLRSPYGAPASRKMLHLQSPPYVTLKVPRKESPPSRFPLWSPYIEKDAQSPEPSLHISQGPQSRALFTYLSKSPVKKHPLQVPLTELLHRERCSISRALFTYTQNSQKSPHPRSLLRAPQKQTLRSQNPSLPVSRSPQ